MKGLSAKVFRAYNALITFQSQIGRTPKHGTVQERLSHDNHVGRMVLISVVVSAVPETHDQSMVVVVMKENASGGAR